MKKYGCCNFLFDVALFFLTGGLWLIWIFVREIRNTRDVEDRCCR